MKKDSLGDRMKRYEMISRHSLTPRMPVIVRIDGKAFHSYTRKFERPFDTVLQDTMVKSAKLVAAEMQGFKLAYCQSDEVTFLLTDYDTLDTDGWFDYDHSKIVSVTASLMTAFFNLEIMAAISNVNYIRTGSGLPLHHVPSTLAFFDARAFNVPREDVVNNFYWRAKDWARNSLTMYASSFFSHKELHGKSSSDRHDMLHAIGKNWVTGTDDRCRNGTFIDATGKEITSTRASYTDIDSLVDIFCKGVL